MTASTVFGSTGGGVQLRASRSRSPWYMPQSSSTRLPSVVSMRCLLPVTTPAAPIKVMAAINAPSCRFFFDECGWTQVVRFPELRDATVDKRLGIRIVDQVRPGDLAEFRHDAFQLVGHTARAGQHADHLALVVSDAEFAERARAAASDDDDVGRMDVMHFAAHKPAAGIDDDIVGVDRRLILVDVFAARERR